MGDKPIRDLADTYVLEDDVMDEMENFEATGVIDEDWEGAPGARDADDDFLDDIESSTVVLDGSPVVDKTK
jgi:hypothetical protein